jgi:SRSO17 transposase
MPEKIAFATKPEMAREMVARRLDEGMPCAFILADAVYGADTRFRRMPEERQQPYALAMRSNQTLRFMEDWTLIQSDPFTMIAELPEDA